jgi:hypothetical protein
MFSHRDHRRGLRGGGREQHPASRRCWPSSSARLLALPTSRTAIDSAPSVRASQVLFGDEAPRAEQAGAGHQGRPRDPDVEQEDPVQGPGQLLWPSRSDRQGAFRRRGSRQPRDLLGSRADDGLQRRASGLRERHRDGGLDGQGAGEGPGRGHDPGDQEEQAGRLTCAARTSRSSLGATTARRYAREPVRHPHGGRREALGSQVGGRSVSRPCRARPRPPPFRLA